MPPKMVAFLLSVLMLERLRHEYTNPLKHHGIKISMDGKITSLLKDSLEH